MTDNQTVVPAITLGTLVDLGSVPPAQLRRFNEVFPNGVVPSVEALAEHVLELSPYDAIQFLLTGEHRTTALAAVAKARQDALDAERRAQFLPALEAFVAGWAAQNAPVAAADNTEDTTAE